MGSKTRGHYAHQQEKPAQGSISFLRAVGTTVREKDAESVAGTRSSTQSRRSRTRADGASPDPVRAAVLSSDSERIPPGTSGTGRFSIRKAGAGSAGFPARSSLRDPSLARAYRLPAPRRQDTPCPHGSPRTAPRAACGTSPWRRGRWSCRSPPWSGACRTGR